jgi:hypothetical protein
VTQRFSVGSFNVRNLVPPSHQKQYHFFYSADRKNCYWDGGPAEKSYYRKKINWLAGQLDRMDCDVVCFQEIFHLDALQDVIAVSSYAGKCSLYMAGETVYSETEYEGIPARVYNQPRVALLVRHPFKLESAETLTHFPDNFDLSRIVREKTGREWQIHLQESGRELDVFNRPLIRARIRLPKQFARVAGGAGDGPPSLVVLAAHLKSKRPISGRSKATDPLQYAHEYLQEYALGQARALLLRGVESAALRSYALESLVQHPAEPLLVVGDLNDGPRSITTDIAGGLSQPAIFGSGSGVDMSYRQARDLSADLALYSSYHLQTRRSHRDVYFTHIYDGFHDCLDHVLVSSHFVPLWMRDGQGMESIGKVGTLRVLNDHLLNAELDAIQARQVGKFFHTRSDHGQLSVRVDWFEEGEKRAP